MTDDTARYDLTFTPFLKNAKEIIVETREYKEARFRLDYLLSTKGFGLLTDSPGRGKTIVIRNGARGLNPSLYKVIYFSLSTLTVMDFYRNLAAQLGMEPSYRKNDNCRIIQEAINRLALEKRQTPLSTWTKPTTSSPTYSIISRSSSTLRWIPGTGQ